MKRGKPLTRKTPLRRKYRSAEERVSDREEGEKLWALYMRVWNTRPHICEATDKPIHGEPRSTMFHHVLPKAKYPQYKYEEWNIMLLLPRVHEQAELNIDKTPRVKARKELLMANKL